MIQNRPKLAVQPIRPAKSVTINGVVLSVYNGKKGHYKMKKLKLGDKNKSKAHLFKACKGGQCTIFYYTTTGKDVGKWYKKGSSGWAQTKLINSKSYLLLLLIPLALSTSTFYNQSSYFKCSLSDITFIF